MELAKRITGVIYLERNNFVYFDMSVGGAITYQYPAEVISDLEVLSEDLLIEQVGQLLQTNNITPTQAVIFLSPSLLFEKKLPLPNQAAENQETAEKFIETVPFEAVSSTKFSLPDGVQVIAANENFYSSIKTAFEKQGFQILSVFPADVFQEDLSVGIQIELAGRLLGKIENMKQYNLLEQKEVILPEKKTPSLTPEKKSKNRLYILGGVFGGLVLVLIVMLLLQK